MNEKLRTKIFWEINNYCTGGCSYCPTNFWGGAEPRIFTDYINAAQIIINHYTNLDRLIDWSFTGGEPLEFFEFPSLLKLCKENKGTINLTTNGGKIWMDWWAIEPHVDNLNLTYHYWQNPNLIKYIVTTFRKKDKNINVSVPIRPDFFEQDIARCQELEMEFGISVNKQVLYQYANPVVGIYNYSKEQLKILFGENYFDKSENKELSLEEKNIRLVKNNPKFTGQLCNVGIETLKISYDGWISGSSCNNLHLGNIWNNYELPNGPSLCKMQSCVNGEDQKITKFN